jgi:hypothetical protein
MLTRESDYSKHWRKDCLMFQKIAQVLGLVPSVDRLRLLILPPAARHIRDAVRPESRKGFSIKGILVDIYTSCRARRTRPKP